jgi:anaphase-promoting complex subunit 7
MAMMRRFDFAVAICLAGFASAFVPSSQSAFGVGRSTSELAMSIPNPLDTATSGLASICRLPAGVTVLENIAADQKPQLKVLYDVENSRECRKVREKITELDLVVENVVPAAPNSRVFKEQGYKYSLREGTTIPRLEITDAGGEKKVLSGDEEILHFFDEAFSLTTREEDAKAQALTMLRDIGNFVAGVLRIGRGVQVSPAATNAPRPEKPLVLYSYEGNQFCRLVREVLTELDLQYELRSAGKGSPRREELAEITGGSTQCPFLQDPNTNIAMAESADIISYLYKTYARYTPPNELLHWASDVILPLARPLFKTLTPIQAGFKGEDTAAYDKAIADAKGRIKETIESNPVVMYTYKWSPFSVEAKALLDNLNIPYKEISLGKEWIPGLLESPETRAALLEMTGQSSLPHCFIGGKSIGGIFSGTPGLVPSLEQGTLRDMILEATKEKVVSS